MSGLSEAAKALLLSMAAPTKQRPADSFTRGEAASLWKCSDPAAWYRIKRGLVEGALVSTRIGRVAYYHAPAPSPP